MGFEPGAVPAPVAVEGAFFCEVSPPVTEALDCGSSIPVTPLGARIDPSGSVSPQNLQLLASGEISLKRAALNFRLTASCSTLQATALKFLKRTLKGL